MGNGQGECSLEISIAPCPLKQKILFNEKDEGPV